MDKLAALVLVALVAQSYATGSLVTIDQEADQLHSRKLLQNGQLINAVLAAANRGLELVTLGALKANSSVIAGNGTLTANLNLKVTNLLNPNDNTVIKSSTGFTNNTAYTYTNSTTQIKDGIYGALTGNSSKIINTNVGAATGAGVNGLQVTGGKNELYINGSGIPTKFEGFQGSFQLQNNKTLFGFINVNTATNTSTSQGDLSFPFRGTTGLQANTTALFGRK